MNSNKTSMYFSFGAVIVLVLAFAYLVLYSSKPTDADLSLTPNPVSVINTADIKNVATQISARQGNGAVPDLKITPGTRNNPFQPE